jgi:hypothetical protein
MIPVKPAKKKTARAAEPKLPSEKYTVTLSILQEFLEMTDERALLTLWHQWSKCTKRQEFNVLAEALQAYT